MLSSRKLNLYLECYTKILGGIAMPNLGFVVQKISFYGDWLWALHDKTTVNVQELKDQNLASVIGSAFVVT